MNKIEKLKEIKSLLIDGIITDEEFDKLKTEILESTTSTDDNTEIMENYKSVQIGDQEWMLENLNVDKFRNGDVILECKTNKEWERAGKEGIPAWCYYENDPEYGKIYGKLYNWYAVNDPRCLAPLGWEIPSDEDWNILRSELEIPLDIHGGPNDAYFKSIKSSSGWAANEMENGNGSNKSGFSALPGGGRFYWKFDDEKYHEFSGIRSTFYFWSSKEISTKKAYYFFFVFGDCEFWDDYKKKYGLSVRCIRQ